MKIILLFLSIVCAESAIAGIRERIINLVTQRYAVAHIGQSESHINAILWDVPASYFQNVPYLVIRFLPSGPRLIGCFSHSDTLPPRLLQKQESPICQAWMSLYESLWPAEKTTEYQNFFSGDLLFHPFLPEIENTLDNKYKNDFIYKGESFFKKQTESAKNLEAEIKWFNLFLNDVLHLHIYGSSPSERDEVRLLELAGLCNPLFPILPPIWVKKTHSQIHFNILYLPSQ